MFFSSCSTTKLVEKTSTETPQVFSEYEKNWIDSVLTVGLNTEALYTLISNVKPVSSIGFSKSYPIAKDSLSKDGDKWVTPISSDSIVKSLQELDFIHQVCHKLSNDSVTFVFIPFKKPYKGKRNYQLLAVRNSRFKALLHEKTAFFAQWGFTQHVAIQTVLTAIEFEQKHDRYRAYGYLFGYPEYAIDFFVSASLQEEESDVFVEREFIHLPVMIEKNGYFTYAVPVNHQRNEEDEKLLKQTEAVLNNFRKTKAAFIGSDSTFHAFTFLKQNQFWLQN
jgi:hypothetical protein